MNSSFRNCWRYQPYRPKLCSFESRSRRLCWRFGSKSLSLLILNSGAEIRSTSRAISSGQITVKFLTLKFRTIDREISLQLPKCSPEIHVTRLSNSNSVTLVHYLELPFPPSDSLSGWLDFVNTRLRRSCVSTSLTNFAQEPSEFRFRAGIVIGGNNNEANIG